MTSPSVGAQLAQARIRLQVTLKDVAEHTKIQPWVLEALEEDRLHSTMSPVYVKGFLTTYAKFLRLDAAALVAQLVPASPSLAEPSPDPQLDVSLVWAAVRRLVPLAIGAAALAGLVALNPLQWVTSGIAAKLASVTVTPKPPAAQEALLHLEPNQPLELSIAARRETWISVVADGRLVAQQQLHPGDQELWRARRRFELIVGVPSRVEILLNGQSISPFAMAHQGRLTITRQSIRALDEQTAPAARTAQSPVDAP